MGVIVTLILFVVMAKVTAPSVVTSVTDSSYIDDGSYTDESIMKVYENKCECIKFDCGCCQYLKWNVLSLDGELCVNASYLQYEYGISLTMTYNNVTIINETISARNPPPICFGEDIVDSVQLEVCLRIYDIDIGVDMFHACFEIIGKFMHIKISSIKLGCVTTKVQNQMKYVESKAFHSLQLLGKRKNENLKIPNVILV